MTGAVRFGGRAAIQQRVLPAYRAGLFDALARRSRGGLEVFAGFARPAESIRSAEATERARWTRAENLHLLAGPFYACYQRGLLNWLERSDPDVLVVEANPRYLSTSAGIRWMRQRGRPVIGWGMGAPASGPLTLWWRRRFLRRLDAVIAYSTRGAAEYAAAGVPVGRIFVAPNAVEPAARRLPRRRPTTTSRAPRLIFVGRLQARKRVDYLLGACAGLRPAPHLTIVGDGPDRDRLETLALRIHPSTVFVGAAYGRDLLRLLDQADLFVLPGTGGLALQQALARGLPVLAARGDGSQEDMVTPRNGWLVRPEDPAALTAGMAQALAERGRWKAMGQASHELARWRFNPDAMVEVFVRVLSQTGGRAA